MLVPFLIMPAGGAKEDYRRRTRGSSASAGAGVHLIDGWSPDCVPLDIAAAGPCPCMKSVDGAARFVTITFKPGCCAPNAKRRINRCGSLRLLVDSPPRAPKASIIRGRTRDRGTELLILRRARQPRNAKRFTQQHASPDTDGQYRRRDGGADRPARSHTRRSRSS